jgi:biotin synthase
MIKGNNTMSLFSIADDLYQKSIHKSITGADFDTIISWPEESMSILFACADQVRRHFFDNRVVPCSLMNIKSGGCSEDCSFCSQSAHNTADVTRSDLADPKAIVEQFEKSRKCGLDFCVVSSGRKLATSEIRIVAKALKSVGAPSHASLGILSEEEFRLLKEAGVVCYNHNLETGRSFFKNVCTTHTYDDRIATVKRAKKAGIHVCCGGIFGLGESWTDRRSLCLELMALEVDTVPINFFNPISGTRASPPTERPLEFLKIVSMFRLALPDKTIKVCGGREFHLGNLQPLIFFSGANGYVSGGYLTTKGDGVAADDRMIEMLGLKKSRKSNSPLAPLSCKEGKTA